MNETTLRLRRTLILAASIGVLCAPALAADISKLQNTTALNLPGAWTGNVVPGTGDVMLWDSIYTTPGLVGTLSQLGADLSVQGLKVTNVGGAANAATTQVGFQDTSSAHTLTIGSSGINMAAATQTLLIQSKVTLGTDQTWNITNANTGGNPTGQNFSEDLSFFGLAGNLTTSGAAFDLAGHTVTTTGTGTIDVGNGYLMSHGTINIGNSVFVFQGGGSKLTTVASDVTLNVGATSTLWFFTTSGGVTSNATVNLNGGTLRMANNNAATNFTMTGALNVNSASTIQVSNNLSGSTTGNGAGFLSVNSNLLGSAALTVTNTSTGTINNGNRLHLGGDNSGYTGTISFSGASRESRLTSATAGSTAATWVVNTGHTLQVDGVSVQLGTLNGAGTLLNSHASNPATLNIGAGTFTGNIASGGAALGVTKVGPGTLTLSGANTYAGPTNVNGGVLNVTPAQAGTGAVTVGAATLAVQLPSFGGVYTLSNLTTGATPGSTLLISNGTLPDPFLAPFNVTSSFTVSNPTTIKIAGTGLDVGTAIPLIDYTGSIGGMGFNGLSLSLPARTVGMLVNNTSDQRVDVDITSLEQVKWNGDLGANWDVDPDGTGTTGTANWLTTVSAAHTRYLQGTGGTDTVNFDDTATSTTVNLTTTLTPIGASFTNGTKDYTLTGPGKLSGTMTLTKTGAGKIILLTISASDYTGVTNIYEGTLQLGDGVTAGAGVGPTGPLSLGGGTLAINRVEDVTLANAITGFGNLRKDGTNVVTLTGNNTFVGPVAVNGGTLRYNGTATISGAISGPGTLEVAGGTVQLAGSDPNTVATTNVTGGILQFSKTAGVNAINGNLTISGTGVIHLLQGEQIPDSATITFLGTSADSAPTQASGETVANVVVNAGAPTGQFIMKNTFTVTGTGTVQNGIFGTASGATTSVNAVVMSGGILRVAAGSATSVLTIGPGGITASGGTIEVKFNAANFDGTLNLGGDFTATGNVAFNNGGYAGPNLNVINLVGARTFNIATGTTTTVAPDFGGTGSLTKTGNGILQLNTSSAAAYNGPTTVNAGSLVVMGSIVGTGSVTISGTGTLAGTGTISPASAGNLSVLAGGHLAPGAGGVGTLTVPLSGGGMLDVSGGVTGGTTGTLLFDLAAPLASDKVFLTGGALNIGTGQLEFNDFTFQTLAGFDSSGTYVLFDGNTPIVGQLGANLIGNLGGQDMILQFADGTNDLVLTAVPEPQAACFLLGGLALLSLLHRNRNLKKFSAGA